MYLWHVALVHVANWSGDERALHETSLNFPGFLSLLSLDKIFEQILNYVVYCQAGSELRLFLGKNVSQRTSLRVNHFFEMLVVTPCSYTQLSIQHHTSIAGNFTKTQLISILEDDLLANNMIVVTGGYHALDIRFDKDSQNWKTHDSNYSYKKRITIEKTALSKAELVDDIFEIINQGFLYFLSDYKQDRMSLHIECYNFQKNLGIQTSVFDSLVKRDPLSLVKNNGLIFISQYCPHLLFTVLSHPEFSTRSGLKTLSTSIKATFRNENFLHPLFKSHLAILLAIFQLEIFHSNPIISLLNQGLKQPKPNETPINGITWNQAKLLPELLQTTLVNSTCLKKTLTKQLLSLDKKKLSLLGTIIQQKPSVGKDIQKSIHVGSFHAREKCSFFKRGDFISDKIDSNFKAANHQQTNESYRMQSLK